MGRWLFAWILCVLPFVACGSETAELVGSAGGGNLGGPDGGCAATPCADNKVFMCGDCEDNDEDGFFDADDPDCLGACDNSENGFYPNLPGAAGTPCKSDCFWDVGNGVGNDDCEWDHRCDPLAIGPAFPPEGTNCPYDPATKLSNGISCQQAQTSQSDTCRERCEALTPNGCDCFGCCAIPGAPTPVWVGATQCAPSTLGDATKCPPCTQVLSCANVCDECELCVGKPAPPPGCTPTEQCPSGESPCGLAGQSPCAGNRYCITGCCIDLPS